MYWEIHPLPSSKFPSTLGQRALPLGYFSGLGKFIGRRRWISQYLPGFGGARIHYWDFWREKPNHMCSFPALFILESKLLKIQYPQLMSSQQDEHSRIHSLRPPATFPNPSRPPAPPMLAGVTLPPTHFSPLCRRSNRFWTIGKLGCGRGIPL